MRRSIRRLVNVLVPQDGNVILVEPGQHLVQFERRNGRRVQFLRTIRGR
jgi:hypothetical protein